MAENQEELHYDAEELAQYFAGEMPDDEAAALETHLGKCQQCRAEAVRISERAAVWFSWTPEAHQAAAAAASTARVASRRELWGYFWPGLAVAGVVASLVLTMVSLQRSRMLKEESQRVVAADRAAGAASQRARQLEQVVIDLQNRIAHLPWPTRPVATAVTVADARPVISLETGTLGPGKATSLTLTVNAAIPSVRVRVALPEISGNAIVDAAVTEGDWGIERRALPVQSGGDGRFVFLVLSAEEVRRLVNRPAQLTVVNRGHASIGTVTMTLLLQ